MHLLREFEGMLLKEMILYLKNNSCLTMAKFIIMCKNSYSQLNDYLKHCKNSNTFKSLENAE